MCAAALQSLQPTVARGCSVCGSGFSRQFSLLHPRKHPNLGNLGPAPPPSTHPKTSSSTSHPAAARCFTHVQSAPCSRKCRSCRRSGESRSDCRCRRFSARCCCCCYGSCCDPRGRGRGRGAPAHATIALSTGGTRRRARLVGTTTTTITNTPCRAARHSRLRSLGRSSHGDLCRAPC